MPGSFPDSGTALCIALLSLCCACRAADLPHEIDASVGEDAGPAGDAASLPDVSDIFDAGNDATPEVGDATSDAGSGPTFPGVGGAATLLPIEVLGPPGTSATVSVPLDEVPAEDVTVRLSLFNLVERGMARLWVNREHIVDLTDPAHGLVRATSAVETSQLTLPSAWFVEGANELTFEYVHQVDDVSGYRVLALALTESEVPLFELSQWEDPDTWMPPDGSPEAVERGRQYFAEISRDGGPTCATCHADDGADFEYYAFSNASIIARAMFHEFPRDEAEDIASYLRSLDVERHGRVWISPFQPGPQNYGAAGDADAALIDDDRFRQETLVDGPSVPWDWAADIDTYRARTSVNLPSWFRWLPREIDEDWFQRSDGELATTYAALAADPSLENAHAFMAAAVRIGKEVMVETGDHQARIDLLRFAAVKLWDWSRKHGFDGDDHGFPNDAWGDGSFWGSPPYPYEVGFAFFEAEAAGLPDAFEQTTQWWWLQIAADPGRGRSNGSRPLNYADVLRAAEFEVGPSQLAFLHLLGSWEESRGPMADAFGADVGPVRLLAVPMSHLGPDDKVALMLRFLQRTREHIDGGGELRPEFGSLLAEAWSAGCSDLAPAQRTQVRDAAPGAVVTALDACGD